MIKKVIARHALKDKNTIQEDLDYWRSQSVEKRIEAVEDLRRQYYGDSARLQRIARVIQRTPR